MTNGRIGKTNRFAMIDSRFIFPIKKMMIGKTPNVAPTLGCR
jgi:hypothetical protein